MSSEQIPENIKRFILRSIDSVSYLEAMLLLRYDPKKEWDARTMAQGLFISEKRADELLGNLCAAGIAAVHEGSERLYRYNPISPELRDMINQLSRIYSSNLIEVTNLIHSKTGRQAQEFGDAFKWSDPKEDP
jgi:hypothetical protein